jgi:hypothetical protein
VQIFRILHTVWSFSIMSRQSTERASLGQRIAATAVEDARQAGLLGNGDTEHLSLRVPRLLLEEARRQSGITSPTQLGIAALALLAQPDPVAEFMRETRGELAGVPPIEI